MMSDEEASGSREQRGLDRIIALSDGVFAFAITLLVLGLAVPTLVNGEARNSMNLLGALSHEWSSFYAYAVSFVVIGVWWVAHHRLFRYVNKYDTTFMWANLSFLLFITIIPFLTELLSTYGDIKAAVILYDAIQAIGGLALATVWNHAIKNDLIISKSLTGDQIKNIRVRGLVPSLTFLIAIGIAVVLPVGVPPSYSNFALFLMFPISRRISRKDTTKD